MKKWLIIVLFPLFGRAQLNEVLADSLISFAKQYQGTKYCYGNSAVSMQKLVLFSSPHIFPRKTARFHALM